MNFAALIFGWTFGESPRWWDSDHAEEDDRYPCVLAEQGGPAWDGLFFEEYGHVDGGYDPRWAVSLKSHMVVVTDSRFAAPLKFPEVSEERLYMMKAAMSKLGVHTEPKWHLILGMEA